MWPATAQPQALAQCGPCQDGVLPRSPALPHWRAQPIGFGGAGWGEEVVEPPQVPLSGCRCPPKLAVGDVPQDRSLLRDIYTGGDI